MKLGIIGAMQIEVEKLKQLMEQIHTVTISGIEFYEGRLSGVDVVAAVSGVGKVNAAVCTQTMILHFSPDKIMNIGVAGGLADGMHIGDVAIASAVVEHDMDTSPVGDPLGFISGINMVEIPCDKQITDILYRAASTVEHVHTFEGIIGSGDQFINSHETKMRIRDTFHAVAAEMEGASIGHVCYMNHVPFGVLRVISDTADDHSHISFAEFAQTAVQISMIILLSFLEIMKGMEL